MLRLPRSGGGRFSAAPRPPATRPGCACGAFSECSLISWHHEVLRAPCARPPRPLYPATSPRSCGDFDRRKVSKNEDPRTGGARRCWAVAARRRRRWSTRRVWHPGASTRTPTGDPLLYPKRTHRFLRFPGSDPGPAGPLRSPPGRPHTVPSQRRRVAASELLTPEPSGSNVLDQNRSFPKSPSGL